jgi:hypothetical protein
MREIFSGKKLFLAKGRKYLFSCQKYIHFIKFIPFIRSYLKLRLRIFNSSDFKIKDSI